MTGRHRETPLRTARGVLHWRFCMFGRFTFLALFTLSALPLGGCAVESAPAAEPPAEVRAEARESARDIYLPPLTRTVSGRVRQGATLATLFARHELDDEAHPLIETIRGVFDPRRLRVDNPYHLVVGLEDGESRQFEYHVDDDEFLQVVRLPLSEALRMVGSGKISDAKTLVTLLYAARFLTGAVSAG